MRRVRTVLGDIAPENLGVTAAHEHLWCDQRLGRDPDFPGHGEKMVLRDHALVVEEVSHFRRAGGGNYRSACKWATRPWVELSRVEASILPSTIGKRPVASSLPSSTPH